MSITATRIGRVERFEDVTLRIEVGAEDVDKAFAEAYDKLRRDVPLEGFRAGKATDEIIRQRLGDQLVELVKYGVYTVAVATVLERDKYRPIPNPPRHPREKVRAELVTKQVVPGKPVQFIISFMSPVKEEESTKAPDVQAPASEPVVADGKIIDVPAEEFRK